MPTMMWSSCILGWFMGHPREFAAAADVTVADLRRDTARWGHVLEAHGPRAFHAWLRELPAWR